MAGNSSENRGPGARPLSLTDSTTPFSPYFLIFSFTEKWRSKAELLRTGD